MTNRFAEPSCVEKDNLLKLQYAKNTEYSNGVAHNLFTKFLQKRGITEEIKNLSKVQINTQLEDFYVSLRKEDGDRMKASSFQTLKYSLNRIIKKEFHPQHIDIIYDVEFTNANQLFQCVMKKLKMEGKGEMCHTKPICADDLHKISLMEFNTPSLLQLKTWFYLQFFFCRRGFENSHDHEKNTFIIVNDGRVEYVKQNIDELTKNHREYDRNATFGGRMYATNNKNCPVLLFKLYLEKLNPLNNYLWQRPRHVFSDQDVTWYVNQKIGINTIKKFMTTISSLCLLSFPYTNHSPRATAITELGEYYDENDIKVISGHKSAAGIAPYKQCKETKRQKMSITLSDALNSNLNKENLSDNKQNLSDNTIPISDIMLASTSYEVSSLKSNLNLFDEFTKQFQPKLVEKDTFHDTHIHYHFHAK